MAGTGFELAELAVEEIAEVATAPAKKVRTQVEPSFLPVTVSHRLSTAPIP